MTVTPASLTALEASARKRSADVEARIDRALKKMRKQGLDINASSLARHAGVSRSVIHRRPQLREQIRTTQPLAAAPDPPPPPATDTESSIITALRTRLKARDAQIADLKAQLRERDHIIATLHGQLAGKPHPDTNS
ncbi:transposase [Mycobacteroides abscessus]|nr:transposase [Mycobacteroides abscessus]